MSVSRAAYGRRVFLTAGAAMTFAGTAGSCTRRVPRQAAVHEALQRTPTPTTTDNNYTDRSPSSEPYRNPRPRDPRRIRANELGMVPILMHHRIVEDVQSEYDMTPSYFWAELERLHREGYHPIRTVELVRRTFQVPAGKSPCVITFDDSSSSQFRYLPDGEIDPDCAIGIMTGFQKKYSDFPATASLYINKNPFATYGKATTKVLRHLNHLGFEIGNHTYDHVELDTLGSSQVQSEFAKVSMMVKRALYGTTTHTMALPMGIEPATLALARHGRSGGTTYDNEGVLLVGANPSHSPYHCQFDPSFLPRIRCSSYNGGKGEFLGTYWLDYLAEHPDQKFISGGNPGHITAPRDFAEVLAPAFKSKAVLYNPVH